MNEMKLIPIDSIHVNYINIIFDTYAILFFIMYLHNCFELQYVYNKHMEPQSYPTNCVSRGNIKNNCLGIVLSVLQLF